MIVDFLISGLLACISAILTLIPDFELPSLGTANEIGVTAKSWARVFPLTLLMTYVTITLGIHLVLRGFDMALWIYHQFWGSN